MNAATPLPDTGCTRVPELDLEPPSWTSRLTATTAATGIASSQSRRPRLPGRRRGRMGVGVEDMRDRGRTDPKTATGGVAARGLER